MAFEDPSKATGSEAEQLAVYRRVRDEIRSRIEEELLKEELATHGELVQNLKERTW